MDIVIDETKIKKYYNPETKEWLNTKPVLETKALDGVSFKNLIKNK